MNRKMRRIKASRERKALTKEELNTATTLTPELWVKFRQETASMPEDQARAEFSKIAQETAICLLCGGRSSFIGMTFRGTEGKMFFYGTCEACATGPDMTRKVSKKLDERIESGFYGKVEQ